MTVYVRIPADRLGVVIGPHGETRRLLEERSGFHVEVDSQENEVAIEGEKGDPLMLMKMQDIVKAIGRGFSPEHAMRLFSDECYFELLDIHDYVGKDKSHVRRMTSRIVGSEGKTRRIIEEQTGCDLAIYGHTVGIVGPLLELGHAKQAVDMILSGAEHASVYRFLENQRRKARRADGELWK
ncbi:MAG: KH domain-containing protein [Thermoplasmatota archaeon]